MGFGLTWSVRDEDHLETALGSATIRAYPIAGNIIPSSTRRDTVFGETKLLVVQESAAQTHITLVSFCAHFGRFQSNAWRSQVRRTVRGAELTTSRSKVNLNFRGPGEHPRRAQRIIGSGYHSVKRREGEARVHALSSIPGTIARITFSQ